MKEDFLTNYLHYAVGGNEVPEIYHKWSGIATLSMCAGRRFWLKFTEEYIIHPNLYIIMVGAAGGRKTSAMNVAKKMFRRIGGAPICAVQITKEALGKEMSKADFEGRLSFRDSETDRQIEFTEYAIFANEWVHFIAVNPKGMIDFLTEIWDEEVYDAKTKNMGDDLIIGPCLPILGCMTPSSATAQFKADLIHGGFARRCIFVWATRGEQGVAVPFKSHAQMESYERAIKQGQFISRSMSYCGGFDWGEESLTWYKSWYANHFKSLKEKTHPATEGYWNSRQDLLLKVALLLEISGGESRELTIPSLVRADKLLAETEEHLPKIFEGAGRNEGAIVANQILEKLRAHGKLPKKKLIREMWGQAKDTGELMSIIDHLIQSDEIVVVKSSSGGPEYYMIKSEFDKQSKNPKSP